MSQNPTDNGVEFIGMIQGQKVSEIHAAQGPAIDRDYVRAFAQAHEQAGFDRVLVPHHSTGPDATLTVAYAASVTERIHFMLAHRPGFVAPTLAARQFASLDQFSGGRLAVHYISGGSDDEQKRDGDWLDHDQRYARTDEYLDVLHKVWQADKPFDHEGAHYRALNAFSEVKPLQTRNGRPHVPVYFGGASEAAIPVAGKYADVYALWGESLEQARELTTRVRAEAAKHGRSVRFSVSFRPILAETEEQAWARATTSWPRRSGCAWCRATTAAARSRARAPGACWPRPDRARGSTSGCGPRSRRRSADAPTAPRWSARPSRSPMRCSTTTTSA
jgi:alkanesulfonate monooxygenase